VREEMSVKLEKCLEIMQDIRPPTLANLHKRPSSKKRKEKIQGCKEIKFYLKPRNFWLIA
jgi:hypothetical protein